MTDRKTTRLERVSARGDVHLISSDRLVIDTAGLARERSATFIYSADDEKEQVTGTVIESHEEGGELHFTVQPEIPGAHAI
jgi:hypothetical protein